LISGSEVNQVSAFCFFLRRGLGQIGERAAFHDARASRDAAGGAERDHRSDARRMILDVPMGGVERLPDAVQVRFAVGGTRRLRGLGLTGLIRGRHHAQQGGDDQAGCSTGDESGFQPILHLRIPSSCRGEVLVELAAFDDDDDALEGGDVG
jgi:hypothetical protein